MDDKDLTDFADIDPALVVDDSSVSINPRKSFPIGAIRVPNLRNIAPL